MKKKVLMLSTDQNIFKEGSEVRNRMIEYGNLFEELHIIIYTDAKNANNMRMTRISSNVFVYPTASRSKMLYFLNAYKIGKNVIGNWKLEIGNSRNNAVVSCQDPFETGLVGYWLKKKFKLPLQIQIHSDFLSPYFWKESIKNKIRVLLAKWLLPKVDKIRVVSQRIKDSLASNVKCQMSDVAILPIFVDTGKIKTAPIKIDLHKKYPDYDFIILMASRLTKEKNIALALEAFSQVKCQASNVKRQLSGVNCLLLIVGAGPEYQNLKFKIKNLKLTDNVLIEPWTTDLPSYYKTADLFLLTSNYEGYGRTIIEAMVAGLPIITTDVGLVGEFFKNNINGTVMAVNDKNGLISAFDDMIKNGEKLKEFSQNNEKAVSRLMTKDEYLKSYAQIL